MDLLFSVSTPTKESKIGDSEFKKHYPSVNQNMSWYSIEPFIRQATREYLLPYIGSGFYERLLHVNRESSDLMQEAAELARDAVSYYSIWLALPHINLVISDLGAQENSSSDGNVQPSQLWRFKNTRWETMIAADKMIDRLLQYLEKNREESEFINWVESSEYQEAGHDLYRTTQELKKYISVESFRFFKALTPFITQSLDLDIIGNICTEQYEDLRDKGDNGNEYEKTALEIIKKALANFSLYRAIPHLRVSFESNSIIYVSSTDGMNIKQTALDSAIDALKRQLLNNATQYIKELRGYLYNNVDEFPIFKEKGYVEYPNFGVIYSPDKIGGIMIN